MKISILDDYFDTLRTLPCFAKLAGHDVMVWTDHVQQTDQLAERLRETEALVLFRERTKISAELLAQLPKLKLISQRSVYPHIDVPACTTNGVLLCSNQHKGTPSFAVVHSSVHNHFNQECHLYSSRNFELNRAPALNEWRQLCSE